MYASSNLSRIGRFIYSMCLSPSGDGLHDRHRQIIAGAS